MRVIHFYAVDPLSLLLFIFFLINRNFFSFRIAIIKTIFPFYLTLNSLWKMLLSDPYFIILMRVSGLPQPFVKNRVRSTDRYTLTCIFINTRIRKTGSYRREKPDQDQTFTSFTLNSFSLNIMEIFIFNYNFSH